MSDRQPSFALSPPYFSSNSRPEQSETTLVSSGWARYLIAVRLVTRYWRLITFGFSHWDLNHLLLNTVLLLILGPIVERRAGAAWLLLVFLTASIASGAGILFKHQLWPSQGVSLGASGGLFGLLGAALVLAFRVPSHTKFARMGVIIVLAVGLTYSFFPGVSMIGHIIGLLVGIAMGFLVPQATARPVVADA